MHLTPRSKVKAMLAALDDDSDNSGENAISVSYSPSTKLSAAISTEDPFLNNSVAEALSAENEEEDEEVVKPRGRLAARMLTVQSDVFDDHSTETARDRVRRMLLAEQQKEPENSRTHHITSDESEDNRVPVKSRSFERARHNPVQRNPMMNLGKGCLCPLQGTVPHHKGQITLHLKTTFLITQTPTPDLSL
jgi:mediator of replication checkpoint protein 1